MESDSRVSCAKEELRTGQGMNVRNKNGYFTYLISVYGPTSVLNWADEKMSSPKRSNINIKGGVFGSG
jgi:hypothetical protein